MRQLWREKLTYRDLVTIQHIEQAPEALSSAPETQNTAMVVRERGLRLGQLQTKPAADHTRHTAVMSGRLDWPAPNFLHPAQLALRAIRLGVPSAKGASLMTPRHATTPAQAIGCRGPKPQKHRRARP